MKPIILFAIAVDLARAFIAPKHLTISSKHRVGKLHASDLNKSSSPLDSFAEDVKARFRIAQESNASGASFKQTVANVLAGEYDEASVLAKVEELIDSAPCGKSKQDLLSVQNISPFVWLAHIYLFLL